MELKNLSVKEITQWVNTISSDEVEDCIELLLQDTRNSVKKLGEKLIKKKEKYFLEQERIKKLWIYEKELTQRGYQLIAGIDEAGRGPLAGPVVASAVILPYDLFIEGVNDSKKLSKNKREELFDIIKEKAIGVGVGIVDHETIDKINILRATELAMTYAVQNLPMVPQHLLIDAIRIPNMNIEQYGIIEGDSKSISIASASIIAKVTRDRIMDQYDKIYPQYGFSSHKGYGTKEHYESIRKYGILPIHRKSFLKNI